MARVPLEECCPWQNEKPSKREDLNLPGYSQAHIPSCLGTILYWLAGSDGSRMG